MGREQHAGRTNPALGRAALDECPLQSRQLSAVSQTFDRDHVAALNLTDGHETAINDLSVYHYRARSALSFPAPLFRPGRAEILTQNVQKSARAARFDLNQCTVQRESHRHARFPFLVSPRPFSAPSTFSGVAGISSNQTPVAS